MEPAALIVKALLNEGRYFVYAPPTQSNHNGGMWSYTSMQVLDRETVVDGKYEVVADDLHYLDALKLARGLNTGTISRDTADDDVTPMDIVHQKEQELSPSQIRARDAKFFGQ